MKLIKNILLATAFMSSIASMNTWAAAQSWNLARDMYLMKESAPAGSPWAFLQSAPGGGLSSGYTPLPSFLADQCGSSPATCWQNTSSGAWIAIPKADYGFGGSGGSFVFRQGDAALHPGVNTQSIIRWTSPITGTVKVHGRVNDLHAACGNGVALILKSGDTQLQSFDVPNGGSVVVSTDAIAVTTGAPLYFVFDSKGDYSCDSTSLDLFISN
ncbi:hypothetical protein NRB16_28360 [Pseudomonas sp. LJDD11]|uniref:hypothetical protein n=1 Tax=unclassified Pseudomonas TaxID=196821 RepID=UPI002097F761|nr:MULTISPECIES: hypothetical protein [unclassified Pseudomonas]MCO8160658.1 hypothetical protein [Pseudomonas sp. 21LCFQ010]MCQ9427432.1 hypothetical protein [Pseudomonas sp. LJDD11]